MEVGALVLLLVGGIVLPMFGWLIGVVLLWVSNAWNVRDKVIGTLFVPGGLGLSIFSCSFWSVAEQWRRRAAAAPVSGSGRPAQLHRAVPRLTGLRRTYLALVTSIVAAS